MKNEKGATMLEFSISMIIFLMFIGLVVDVGIGIHRKSMLTNINKQISRKLAIELMATKNCNDDVIHATIQSEVDKIDLVHVSSWKKEWHAASNIETSSSFTLTLESKAPCYFICNMFPNGLSARSSIVTSVNLRYDNGNVIPCNWL